MTDALEVTVLILNADPSHLDETLPPVSNPLVNLTVMTGCQQSAADQADARSSDARRTPYALGAMGTGERCRKRTLYRASGVSRPSS